ncbi:hypothetical protein [Bacillus cytotoxicus]|nr:hypothetical protein [Bacillus cytotoxicus]
MLQYIMNLQVILKGITKKMKIIRNTADSIFRTIILIAVYMFVSVSETFFGLTRQKK